MPKVKSSNSENIVTEEQKLAELINLLAEIIVDTTLRTFEEQNMKTTAGN